jgi:hypothetical protein
MLQKRVAAPVLAFSSESVKEALKICILRSFIICACHQILLGSNKGCMFLQFIDILINRGNTATIKQ